MSRDTTWDKIGSGETSSLEFKNPYDVMIKAGRDVGKDISKIFDDYQQLNKDNYDRGVVNKTGRVLADLAGGKYTKEDKFTGFFNNELDGTDPAVIAKALTTLRSNQSVDNYRQGMLGNAIQKTTDARLERERKIAEKKATDKALGNYYSSIGDYGITTPTEVVVDTIMGSPKPTTEVIDYLLPTPPPITEEVIVEEPVAIKEEIVVTPEIVADVPMTKARRNRIEKEGRNRLNAYIRANKSNPTGIKAARAAYNLRKKNFRADNPIGSTRPKPNDEAILDKQGNAVLKQFKTTDAGGVETTAYYPVRQDGSAIVGSRGTTATIGSGSATGVGTKVPAKLNKTLQLSDGRTIYVNAQGVPVKDDAGEYLVKTQGTDLPKKNATKKALGNTIKQLDGLNTRIINNPSAIGSIGENVINWAENNLNDILKIPTADRLDRNQIEAQGGTIAAELRAGKESGVMTDRDFDRYMKLVPDVDDSPKEATNKIMELKKQLLQQYEPLKPGYKRQYNSKTGEYRQVEVK